MIIVRLIGGLGNQMFQYAAAKALAIEKKQRLRIDVEGFETYNLHSYGFGHFNIKAKKFKRHAKTFKRIYNFFCKTTYYTETDFGFNPKLFDLKGCNIYLDGYFQSALYFEKHANAIRKDFEIISPLKPITRTTLDHIKSTESVSIHIRRGDYLQNALHNTDKELFYKNAMQIIENELGNPVYFVFSDDMPWVKRNFITNKTTIFVDFNDVSSNFEDLKLMSSCKHNIIANSSFSWWGAWLNNNPKKIVVAPKKWFNDDTVNTKDIIPESWISI
ncbi:MAG: alpha-1,2-fucosyltransferase [Flavobacterium sp.]|nr:alpha-1,2-fucosyltransferase [Flavobacterium sp.]